MGLNNIHHTELDFEPIVELAKDYFKNFGYADGMKTNPAITGDILVFAFNDFGRVSSSATNLPATKYNASQNNGFCLRFYRGGSSKAVIFFNDFSEIFINVHTNRDSIGWIGWKELISDDLKEHQINGTRHTANITGTFNFDWNAYSQFVLTPTGAVTLGNTNLPTGTNSKEIKGIIKAGSAVTLPANWNATADSDAFDNTLDNHFRAWVSGVDVVTFTNKNKAAGSEELTASAINTALGYTAGDKSQIFRNTYDSAKTPRVGCVINVANDLSDLESKINSISTTQNMFVVRKLNGEYNFAVKKTYIEIDFIGCEFSLRKLTFGYPDAESFKTNVPITVINSSTSNWNLYLVPSAVGSGANFIDSDEYFNITRFDRLQVKEHQVNGLRLTGNITGSYNIDWNAASQFILTPTGAVTLGNTNLPVAPNTKVISGVFKASSFAVTFPASWKAKANNDPLSATLDTHFTAETFPDYVLYTLENIPA